MSRKVRYFLSYSCSCRQMSTKIRIVPQLNKDVRDDIVSDKLNPKKHPGVRRMLPQKIPDTLFESVRNALKDRCEKTLTKEGAAFNRYLKLREPPLDDEEVVETMRKIKQKVESGIKKDEDKLSADELKKRMSMVKSKSLDIFKKTTYNWKPVVFDQFTSLLYMMGRLPQDYSVLCRVFNEIAVGDPQFKARTLCDFGSGIGSAIWAAKHFWTDHLKEFYCIDSSSHMLDLSQFLIQGNCDDSPLPGYYYRQFLPSKNRIFDLVVSAYSLIEMPSKEVRLETILNLWNKTGRYLVIVEHGSQYGFKLVTEARDFILYSNRFNNTETSEKPSAHVFAPGVPPRRITVSIPFSSSHDGPTVLGGFQTTRTAIKQIAVSLGHPFFKMCPHDFSCPRLAAEKSVCNFVALYHTLGLGERGESILKEKFSYVILRKGERPEDDPHWPRIVSPNLKVARQSICRLCTSEGKLQEVIFTKAKSGKESYRCARGSRWGDRLPVKLSEVEVEATDWSGKCNENEEENEEENEDEVENYVDGSCEK